MRSLPRISALSAVAVAVLAAVYLFSHGVSPQAQAAGAFSPTALAIGDQLTNESWDAF